MKRIGVIGYGRRLDHVIPNVLNAAPGKVEIAAFVDPSPETAALVKEKHPGIIQSATPEDLAQRDDIDWVLIGSFNAQHRDHAVPAVNAGKHVFCEKPLATTLQDCLDIQEAHLNHPDKSFAVGFVLRYSAFYRRMKQWIDEGRIGDLISMEFNETLKPQHGAAMHGNWRRKSEWAGPMIVEKCCHDIDLMLWMTGSRPARVASFGGLNVFKAANAEFNERYGVGKDGYKYYDRGLATGFAVGNENNITPFSDDKDSIDNQVAIMEMENGARVSFHYCMHSAKIERRFYMCGTRGTIRGDVLTGTLEYTPVDWDEVSEVVKPINGDDHGGGEVPMAEDLVACMFEGVPMPTTVADSLTALFTCFGIEEARENLSVVEMEKYWKQIG